MRCRLAKNCLAFSLVEVIVCLVLLSTLFAAAITGFGQLARQSRYNHARMEGVEQLDELLAAWIFESGKVPVDAYGQIDERTTWTTQLKELPNEAAKIRVELMRIDLDSELPIAVVEVIAPLEEQQGEWQL